MLYEKINDLLPGRIWPNPGTSKKAAGLLIIMRICGSIGPKLWTPAHGHYRDLYPGCRADCARAAAAMGRCWRLWALFLLAGNRLLIDPDTLWQITVGQWIIDHHTVPATTYVYSFTMRGQPWISTQWLAQVMFAKNLRAVRSGADLWCWHHPRGATFALLAKFLGRRLSDSTTLVFVAAALALTRAASAGAAACAGDAGHGGVGRRADRGRRSPRRAVVLAAAADGAVGQSAWRLRVRARAGRADRARCRAGTRMLASRRTLALRWAAFGIAALAAGCCTPYGWNSLLGLAKDSRARRRAAADPGMEAGRISAASARSKSACCSGFGLAL